MLTVQNFMEIYFTCETACCRSSSTCAAPVMLYFEQKLQHPSPSLGLQLSCSDAARELFKGGKKERLRQALAAQSVSAPKTCKVQTGVRMAVRAREPPHTGMSMLRTSRQSSVIKEQGKSSRDESNYAMCRTFLCIKPELLELCQCGLGSPSYFTSSALAVGDSSAEYHLCNSLFKSDN